MIDRINLILKAKNITAKQFAEEIGIQPSGMSHILGGRNNPSLDFVMKVIRRYPEIDINWLMFGKGEMYENPATSIHALPSKPQNAEKQSVVTAPAAQPAESSEPMPDLFSGINNEYQPVQSANTQASATIAQAHEEPRPAPRQPHPADAPVVSQPPAESQPTAPRQAAVAQPQENGVNHLSRPVGHEYPILGQKKILKVVILYEDHSFSEYYPER